MKAVAIFGVGCGGLIFLTIVALVIIGIFVPEPHVYMGPQVPKKYLTKIESLGLLPEGERIKYFYTDSFFDLKDGIYFVTEDFLVVYSQNWTEPETIIRLSEITDVDVEYDDSFLTDSYVFITTVDDFEVSFPVSSEKGGDKRFVKHIESKMKQTTQQ